MKRFRVPIMLLWLVLVFAGSAQATHIRSADVTVERVCGNDLSFIITVTAYLTGSSTAFGGGNGFDDGHVNFGDGSFVLIPATGKTLRPDLGANIYVATFTVVHTYSTSGFYTISYYERDRSAGVLNVPNSGDIPYVSFVTVNATNDFGCNKYPKLLLAPVDRACSRNQFFHSPGAVDPDGDSLSYELVVPAGYGSIPISNYIFPDADGANLYENHSQGNEAGTGPPVFSIDGETGLITWNAPGRTGEYNIAFRIIEWRDDPNTGDPVMLSAITRDMQIIVEECPNIRPDFSLFPSDICVEAGTPIHALIKGIDPESKNVKIEATSEILDFPSEKKPATYSPFPPAFGPSSPPAELNFEWNTDCVHVRQQPYQVIFRITDKPPSGTALFTLKTLSIRVVAPAPVWKNHTLDIANRQAILEWEKYTCANPSKIQIWRKVGSYAYNPGLCAIGIPPNSGYNLVGEVAGSDTVFIDTNNGNNLVAGAQYSYRLVAVFAAPASTRSRVSTEVLIGPIKADAPIITHVSVNETAREGSIRVSWRSPFNISKVQYPGPYKYEVYRAKGFAGDTNFVLTNNTLVSDTTFLDEGINTQDSVYNYRIVLYSNTQDSPAYTKVDTSGIASSVRLTALAGLDKIELAWRDSVPWSNIVQERPWHLIYRGLSADNLAMIDSVDVMENGFTYVDETVDDVTLYYYRVETRGTYGNPLIKIQKNYSQITSLYPINNLLPCKPEASIVVTSCETFRESNSCGQNEFSNSISWEPVFSSTCRADVKSYNVYAADSQDGEYTLIASHITDTYLVETDLPSFARCYRVSAIDAEGHESEKSDPVCNDNCPYYELPNVFTPNGDGCNDLLSASDEDEAQCDFSGIVKCARFVKEVKLTVYNRWGREVYTFNSGDGKSIYINWDGRDKTGKLLESAIYYYAADVTFNTIDPATQSTKIKGWVHLSY